MGPGHPLDNQLLIKLIENFENLPILGVCLGAQALTCYYGGDVIQGSCVKHGKVDTLTIVNQCYTKELSQVSKLCVIIH